jgi:hypothetical protein
MNLVVVPRRPHPHILAIVQQSKGGGLMSHCHMPITAVSMGTASNARSFIV